MIKVIIEYFDEYSSLPTLEVMKLKLDDVENDVLKTTIIDTLKQVTKHFEADDIKFIEKEALPGTGIDSHKFWKGFSELIKNLGPKNKELPAQDQNERLTVNLYQSDIIVFIPLEKD